MAEEQRLTAAEFLQYFLSRYRVEEGGMGDGHELSTPEPIAVPVATVERDEESEATDD